MQVTCLNLESRDVRKMVVRTRRAGGAQTEQQRIRDEYLELCAHPHATAAEWRAIEGHRIALQMRCSHPNLGNGMLPGEYNRAVPPNQCPDCGCLMGQISGPGEVEREVESGTALARSGKATVL